LIPVIGYADIKNERDYNRLKKEVTMAKKKKAKKKKKKAKAKKKKKR